MNLRLSIFYLFSMFYFSNLSWCDVFYVYICNIYFIDFNMKKYLFLIWSFLLLSWFVYFIVNIPKKVILWCTYNYVEKVYDWDTVLAKNLWKVRLLWIDTPETYVFHGLKTYKFYWCGERAKELAKQKLAWKTILFCTDKLSKDKWNYGRKLRYAMINSWSKLIPFGLYLLENGDTRVYKYAPFKYKEQYFAIEKKLKEEKQWVWAKSCFIQDQQVRQKFSSWCDIKWNIDSKWEKYYYLPANDFYSKVKINKSWEKLFCDYKKAEQAWFTRVKEK